VGLRWNTEYVLLHKFDGALQILEARCFGVIMRVADEVIDVSLVVGQEGMDVVLVDHFCALSLRQDEIGKDHQADPAVERKPSSASVLSADLYISCSGARSQHTIRG